MVDRRGRGGFVHRCDAGFAGRRVGGSGGGRCRGTSNGLAPPQALAAPVGWGAGRHDPTGTAVDRRRVR